MLELCLRILSIIGIGLLALLILSVVILLLIFFFPVTYRACGRKDEERLEITVKAKWLFGLLRVRYQYPQPGKVIVKALWFTLYDSRKCFEEEEDKETGTKKRKKEQREKEQREDKETVSKAESAPAAADHSAESTQDSLSAADVPLEEKTADRKIFQLFEKIKYTICNIYDKIKEIWENISYYTALLREEDTKQLITHISFRLGKILKNIRPRHLKADILFGTGSPDTTGYAFGLYCMLGSALGAGFRVEPDFEQAVLRAEFDISGHITLWVLTINGLKLFLDKRLKAFIRKLKREKGAKLDG